MSASVNSPNTSGKRSWVRETTSAQFQGSLPGAWYAASWPSSSSRRSLAKERMALRSASSRSGAARKSVSAPPHSMVSKPRQVSSRATRSTKSSPSGGTRPSALSSLLSVWRRDVLGPITASTRIGTLDAQLSTACMPSASASSATRVRGTAARTRWPPPRAGSGRASRKSSSGCGPKGPSASSPPSALGSRSPEAPGLCGAPSGSAASSSAGASASSMMGNSHCDSPVSSL
mmetsp:Transcript_104600/g.291368  ORF Transcript_104600/g.291368 Transcript_104600/m.291368 type:complete len:232 (+) Transcript_104600:476-1171(+)